MAQQEIKPGLRGEVLDNGLIGGRAKIFDPLFYHYNKRVETNDGIELLTIGYVLNNPWLRSAIDEVRDGVVVEIGSYGGLMLDHLATRYIRQLQTATVLGIDKGEFEKGPVDSGNFKYADPETLFSLDEKQILRQDVLKKLSNGGLFIWRHNFHPNTFAIYGAEPQDVLDPNKPIDLLFLKCMLGYLLRDASLEDLDRDVFSKAKRVFMVDYVGKCKYSKVDVPEPEVIATSLSGMDVSYTVGNAHFVLYGKRRE